MELTAVIWEEQDGFVSLCPELGVVSCGSTATEAQAMLMEAVALYLENVKALDGKLVP